MAATPITSVLQLNDLQAQIRADLDAHGLTWVVIRVGSPKAPGRGKVGTVRNERWLEVDGWRFLPNQITTWQGFQRAKNRIDFDTWIARDTARWAAERAERAAAAQKES